MNPLFSIALAAAVLLSSGQPASGRTCRIVFPERPQDAPRFAHLFDGTQSRQVTLPSMNLSELIELPDGDLVIALSAEEIRDPKQIPPGTLLLNVPKKVSDFYIVVGHEPDKQPLPLSLNIVDTGGGALKPGETLWFNFTPHQITAMLGNSNLTISPMKRAVSSSPIQESGYYAARFAYKVNGSDSYSAITSQQWWHDAESRHIGFIMNSGGKLPKIFFFRDFRDPVPVGEPRPEPGQGQ